jgi:RNA polymerase sigma-70 factor, ECF subfamily
VSGQPLDSTEILGECILGEYSREAWRGMYDQYSARVWRYVARWVGSDADSVADVVQDTFLAAGNNWSHFDPARGTVWAWLSGIAHKQAALLWRKRNRGNKRHNESTDGAAAKRTVDVDLLLANGTVASPVAALELAETINEVRLVMNELKSEYAALLSAKYGDGMSVAEIHEAFGGTIEAVRSKLARARTEFRELYTRQED